MMKIYDLENHFYSRAVLNFFVGRTEYPYMTPERNLWFCEGAGMPLGSIGLNDQNIKLVDELADADEVRLSFMDKAAVSTACISSAPHIEGLGREDSVRLARATNDAAAEACRRHPDRFIGTICLPARYVEESLEELDRAVNVLGLKYWHTHSNFGDECLYEDKFEPILTRCEELGVPFYVHPHNSSSSYLLDSGSAMASAAFGFTVDAMKTALRLIIGGTFDRHPNLKMILGHMGEIFPYCLKRMDNRFDFFRVSGSDPFIKCEHDLKYYFEHDNIFVTTSGIEDPDVVDLAIKKIGIDHIIFGSDYPYENLKSAVDFVCSLSLSDEDKAKILYKNAEKYILNK